MVGLAMKPTPRSHQRSRDQVQISISLPKELLAAIDAAAAEEQRDRSNWLRYITTKALETRKSGEAVNRNESVVGHL